jgi:hypothetical protein
MPLLFTKSAFPASLVLMLNGVLVSVSYSLFKKSRTKPTLSRSLNLENDGIIRSIKSTSDYWTSSWAYPTSSLVRLLETMLTHPLKHSYGSF